MGWEGKWRSHHGHFWSVFVSSFFTMSWRIYDLIVWIESLVSLSDAKWHSLQNIVIVSWGKEKLKESCFPRQIKLTSRCKCGQTNQWNTIRKLMCSTYTWANLWGNSKVRSESNPRYYYLHHKWKSEEYRWELLINFRSTWKILCRLKYPDVDPSIYSSFSDSPWRSDFLNNIFLFKARVIIGSCWTWFYNGNWICISPSLFLGNTSVYLVRDTNDGQNSNLHMIIILNTPDIHLT